MCPSKLGCLRGGLSWVEVTVARVEGEEVALTSGVVVEEGNTAQVSSDWLGVSISIGIGVEDEGPAVLVPGVSPEDGLGVVTLSVGGCGLPSGIHISRHDWRSCRDLLILEVLL